MKTEFDVKKREILVTLPFRLVNALNAREHHHARARRAAEERSVAGMSVKPRVSGIALKRWTVTFTRLYTRKRMDDDGCVASCKNLRDGVADALGIDDGSAKVKWRYDQRKAPSYGVEIRLEARC